MFQWNPRILIGVATMLSTEACTANCIQTLVLSRFLSVLWLQQQKIGGFHCLLWQKWSRSKACVAVAKSQRRRGLSSSGTRRQEWMHRLPSTHSPLHLSRSAFWILECTASVSGCCWKNSAGEREKTSDEWEPPWRATQRIIYIVAWKTRARSSEPWWIKLESNARGCIIHAICFIHTKSSKDSSSLSCIFQGGQSHSRSVSRVAPHKCEHTSSFLFVVAEHTAKNCE